MTYGVDGSSNVSVNTFTYQTVPPQQQHPPPQQQQQVDTQSPLVPSQQPAPPIGCQPVAMQALAGMTANSAYQILTQSQQQGQGSPSSTQQQQQQQQQQAAVSLPPPTQHSDYSCGTPEGMCTPKGGLL